MEALDASLPDLKPEGRQLHDQLLCQLEAGGPITPGHRLALLTVVRAHERLAEVRDRLTTDGPVTRGSVGQARAHPLLKVEVELLKEVATGLRRLGLTPPPARRRRGEWMASTPPLVPVST